jgi:tRNA modification GTPase
MFAVDDTIVAIATPVGRAGLGVVRLSGPRAEEIARALAARRAPLKPRHATFAVLNSSSAHDSASSSSNSAPVVVRDQAILTFFPAPRSYTGDDVVEISAHGSPVVLEGIVRAAIERGARLARPGEFTLRAFLNGKLDLVQAEAVADLVDAVTPLQARAAFDQLEGTLTARIRAIEAALFDLMARLEASLDFPDEGYHFVERDAVAGEIDRVRASIGALLGDSARGRLVREGAQIAIVGTPNVGKSSLFNALLNARRAIVTPIPGTTRDVLAERADIRGISVSLLDTAGVRDAGDVIEQEGIARAREAAKAADLVVVVLDRSRPLSDEDRRLAGAIDGRGAIAANKIDLAPAWTPAVEMPDAVEISAATGEGLDRLVERIAERLGEGEPRRDAPGISNVRHIALLRAADAALARAAEAAGRPEPVPEEFLLADLQEASASLQEITGQRTTEDLLAHIFERFCIGK